MIYPDTVVTNIIACRVFRNVKFGRHSQVLIMPTLTNTGDTTQHDYAPGKVGENLYHMDDTVTLPTSVESHRRGIEKPDTHLGGVEVTKVIEFTRN